jgi:hypothetical protein
MTTGEMVSKFELILSSATWNLFAGFGFFSVQKIVQLIVSIGAEYFLPEPNSPQLF